MILFNLQVGAKENELESANANTLEAVHRIFIAPYVDSKKAKAPGQVKPFIEE